MIIYSLTTSVLALHDHKLHCITSHNYIGPEHLLLGLLREGEGVAARVLENLGADPSNIRTQASCLKVERVTQILGWRTKNNPCIIGELGVGKTAIAEGLVLRISNGDVLETIEGKKIS